MKAPEVLGLTALIVAAALAGCTRAEPVNPNLLAPKMVLNVDDAAQPVIFVHSAFGERVYDRIEVAINNSTLRTVEERYSLEQNLDLTNSFLEVRASHGESEYAFRGDVSLEDDGERLQVVELRPNGEWSEPRSYNLPYATILDRVEA